MKKLKKVTTTSIEKPNEQRPFTLASDILILIMLIEDKASARDITVMLGRDVDSINNRIKFLKESGRLIKIHKMLMARKGLYAMKYIKANKKD